MKQNYGKSIADFARFILVAVWIVVGTLMYAAALYVIVIFSRKAAGHIAVLWSRNLAFFSGVKIRVDGLEKLERDRNYIFMGNHTSYFDIIALYCSLPYRLSFVAKKMLFAIPIWGWALYIVGHIPIDRDNPKRAKVSIEKAVARIKSKKRSIIGFPEGSRSRSTEIGEFKLGLFSLAIKAGVDIVPVVIHGARDVMPKESLYIRSGEIRVQVLEPILIADYTQSDKYTLAQATKARFVEALAKNIAP